MSQSFLFVMWAGGGNVTPFLGLAERLQADGHSVTALATASLGDRLRGADLTVVDPPDGWLPSADGVLAAVDRVQPNAILVDYMLTGAMCGAEASGVPTAALVHTLYSALLEGGAPNPIGMAGSVADINAVRADVGLEPVEHFGDLLAGCDRVLVTVPSELDLPLEVRANVTYLGAILGDVGLDADWQPPMGDGPLIVVSIGTAGDPAQELPLLEKIFEAVEPLPVRVLATVADYIDRSQLTPPANITVSGYVSHVAVLPQADLMITHAGMGSVVAALAHGVPMVCVPLDREQPDNARAVARIGAGITVDASEPADVLRRAIERALSTPEPVRLTPEPQLAVELLTRMAPRRQDG